VERAGIEQLPEAVAADAGYWNEQHMDEVVANKHIPVLVAPDKGTRGTPKRWLTSGRASWMRTVLATEHGQERYRKRKQTVEPLFGNTKHNGGFYRFHRRGRTKVRLEWRLLMLTHNLTKLHRRRLAATHDGQAHDDTTRPTQRPGRLSDSLRPLQAPRGRRRRRPDPGRKH
jgi:hypothetical protein